MPKDITALEIFREEKDDFFATHHQSPLTPAQKKTFKGLVYFPEDPALRFELQPEPFPRQETVEFQTSTGDVQSYVRYARITFDVNGTPAGLTVYSSEHGFFLPFVDSLADGETYGAGRYLDPARLKGGKLLVDFNYGYNPYCAYNERWSCPLTPFENRLKVPIRAGEKLFNW